MHIWRFAEDRLGSLEPGRLADVAVLDGDLFATLPDRIADLRVMATIVDGEVAFAAATAGARAT